jgi:hypothetical protein
MPIILDTDFSPFRGQFGRIIPPQQKWHEHFDDKMCTYSYLLSWIDQSNVITLPSSPRWWFIHFLNGFPNNVIDDNPQILCK